MLCGMTAVSQDLPTAIEESGYYPDVVSDAVKSAVAGEQVVSFLVHHEPTIDERDEVRRHVTVLVLTPSRLIPAPVWGVPPAALASPPPTNPRPTTCCRRRTRRARPRPSR